MPTIYRASRLAVDIGRYMSNSDSLGKRLADAGIMIIMGLATIFAVLIIIWGALAFMRIFTYDIPNRRKAAKEAEGSAAEAEAAPSVQTPETPADAADSPDDKELVAVITAAIAASEGKPASSLRVVSFRRAGAPRWNER